ncbi:MAG: nucleotidyltransferase domain-containing protein, partial [Candidatus Cyclobacteriaceae bacterium M3_2C_046]
MHTNNDILNQINREVKLIQPEAEVVLYGSRARGDFKVNSDWDILV